MLGAIIGDIAGSRFEGHNRRSKVFNIFSERSRFTDDTVMTLAVAKAISECKGDYSILSDKAVYWMQKIGSAYPHCGYGRKFKQWVLDENPQPYQSYGNGATMRVSACAEAAKSLEEAISLAKAVTVVTHDHPEGIKGATVVAALAYMAGHGAKKEEMAQYAKDAGYDLDFTLDGIRDTYQFSSSCQGSVPQAIVAFLEAKDFEDAIRGAVSIGGDSDTIAAIAGSIAEPFFGIPEYMQQKALSYLDVELLKIYNEVNRSLKEEV